MFNPLVSMPTGGYSSIHHQSTSYNISAYEVHGLASQRSIFFIFFCSYHNFYFFSLSRSFSVGGLDWIGLAYILYSLYPIIRIIAGPSCLPQQSSGIIYGGCFHSVMWRWSGDRVSRGIWACRPVNGPGISFSPLLPQPLLYFSFRIYWEALGLNLGLVDRLVSTYLVERIVTYDDLFQHSVFLFRVLYWAEGWIGLTSH